jgi:hypothetical protein
VPLFKIHTPELVKKIIPLKHRTKTSYKEETNNWKEVGYTSYTILNPSAKKV